MTLSRHHSDLYETYARELDRRVREQLKGMDHRPAYARDFSRDVQHLISSSKAGFSVGGRFVWFKRLVRRLVRPLARHQDLINRQLIERLIELHEMIHELGEVTIDRHQDLSERLAKLELAKATQGSPRENLEDAEVENSRTRDQASDDWILAADSSVILGVVPSREPDQQVLYHRPLPGVTRVVELDDLPARDASLDEILCAQLVEEFSHEELRDKYLPHWLGLLKPGGRLVIVADDTAALLDRIQDGTIDSSQALEWLNQPTRTGQPRRSWHSPSKLRDLFMELGLEMVTVRQRRQRPDVNVFGFEISAMKPAEVVSIP